MKYKMLDRNYIKTVRDAGFEVQASIFVTPHEQRAVHDAVSIQLTDFWWFQTDGRKPFWTASEPVRLQAGEKHFVSHPAADGDFNAMTLRLSFCGDITVTLTDWRQTREGWKKVPCTYRLHRDSHGEEILGLRLYKTSPEITVTCGEAPADVSIRAALYKL
jgi:hypothetical protein